MSEALGFKAQALPPKASAAAASLMGGNGRFGFAGVDELRAPGPGASCGASIPPDPTTCNFGVTGRAGLNLGRSASCRRDLDLAQ